VVGPWAELGSEAVEVAQRRLYGGNVVVEHPGVDCGGNVLWRSTPQAWSLLPS
jgi:hypothetical protein